MTDSGQCCRSLISQLCCALAEELMPSAAVSTSGIDVVVRLACPCACATHSYKSHSTTNILDDTELLLVLNDNMLLGLRMHVLEYSS